LLAVSQTLAEETEKTQLDDPGRRPNFTKMRVFLLTATVVAAFGFEAPSAPRMLLRRLEESRHALLTEVEVKSQDSKAASPGFGVRVSPLEFGGDPLGQSDSAAALQACITFCQNYSVAIDALGHFPGDASFHNGHYIANGGGCEIDLGGGEFLLSKPVLIPEYLGNIRLGHGSLVADDTPGVFPPNAFLLVVGIEGSCKV
jgi:hypothetical protein